MRNPFQKRDKTSKQSYLPEQMTLTQQQLLPHYLPYKRLCNYVNKMGREFTFTALAF